MTLKEYTKEVKRLINDIKLSAFLARPLTKKWIEANWNKNMSPSYTAATIKQRAAGK